MGNLIDISGCKFGRLHVLGRKGTVHGEAAWECFCECGNSVIVGGYALRNGATKSCGCLKSDIAKTVNLTHGLSYHPLRTAYSNMKTRCYNPKYALFGRYGGRGIAVCDEWVGKDGYQKFYNWAVSNGYDPGKSLDRIDNNKGYSPDNCRWATPTEQSNNRSTNRRVESSGVSMTLAEWSRELDVNQANLRYVLERGFSIQDIKTGVVKCL